MSVLFCDVKHSSVSNNQHGGNTDGSEQVSGLYRVNSGQSVPHHTSLSDVLHLNTKSLVFQYAETLDGLPMFIFYSRRTENRINVQPTASNPSKRSIKGYSVLLK